MPYKVWCDKLSRKLDLWYKTLQECDNNYRVASDKLGIENMFWNVVGRLRNPLLKAEFTDLTFYQRVWILKSLCEHCMLTQTSLRDAIDGQSSDETREYVLGTDTTGAIYIHFPQFCGADLRVYKKYEYIKKSRQKASQPVQRNSKSNDKANKNDTSSNSSIDVCNLPNSSKCAKNENNEEESKESSSPLLSARALRLARRSIAYDPFEQLPVRTRRKRKLPETKASEESSANKDDDCSANKDDDCTTNLSDGLHDGRDDCSTRLTVSEAKAATNGSQDQSSLLAEDDTHQKLEPGKDQAADTSTKPNDIPTNTETDESIEGSKTEHAISSDTGKLETEEKPVEVPEEPIEEDLPEEVDLVKELTDMESFQLVCQSVDDLKELCNKFEGSRGKEKELWEKLNGLFSELAPYDAKLQQLNKRAKEKMKKEQDEYEEPDEGQQVIADDWETEEEAAGSSADSSAESDASNDAPAPSQPEEDPAPAIEIKPPPKKVKVQVEESSDSPTPEEQKEFGVSAFGRIRKRRVIPNNLEDDLLFAKRKKKNAAAAAADSRKTEKPAEAQIEHSPQNSDILKSGEPVKSGQTMQSITPPNGFTLVKMQKQMYLVPTAQLPGLLAQTGTSGVQIINRPVKVVKNADTKVDDKLSSSQNQTSTRTAMTITSSAVSSLIGNTTTISNASQLLTAVVARQKQQQNKKASGAIRSINLSEKSNSVLQAAQKLNERTISAQKISTSPEKSQIASTPLLSQPATVPPDELVLEKVVSSSNTVRSPKSMTIQQSSSGTTPQTSAAANSQLFTIVQSPVKGSPAVAQGSHLIIQQTPGGSKQNIVITPQLLKTLSNANIKVVPSRQHLDTQSTVTQAKPSIVSVQAADSTPADISDKSPSTLANSLVKQSRVIQAKQLSAEDLKKIINVGNTSYVAPKQSKYASNITVKTLLNQQQAATTKPTAGVSIVQPHTKLVAAGNSCIGVVSSQVLDAAVKAVVTEPIKTTLPTAAMKVPAPLTLPSAFPRRPPTKTTQSMKSPILISSTCTEQSNAAASMNTVETVANTVSKSVSQVIPSVSSGLTTKGQVIVDPTAETASVISTGASSVPASSFVQSTTTPGHIIVQASSLVQNADGKLMLKVLPQNVGVPSPVKVAQTATPSNTRLVQVALPKGISLGNQVVRLGNAPTSNTKGQTVQIVNRPAQSQTIKVGNLTNQVLNATGPISPIRVAHVSGQAPATSGRVAGVGGQIATVGGRIVHLATPPDGSQPKYHVVQQSINPSIVANKPATVNLTTTKPATAASVSMQQKQLIVLNYPGGQTLQSGGNNQLVLLNNSKLHIPDSTQIADAASQLNQTNKQLNFVIVSSSANE